MGDGIFLRIVQKEDFSQSAKNYIVPSR